jgi:lysophospholipase L1-like esterase
VNDGLMENDPVSLTRATMRSRIGNTLCSIVLCLPWAVPSAVAEQTQAAAVAAPNIYVGDYWDKKLREQREAIQRNLDNIDLVFVGDSITDAWGNGGSEVWSKYFAPLKALNLGLGGDQTQHVLWRLQNGQLEGYKARLFVVMIGTNNSHPPAEVAQGIKAILDEIKHRQPQANILLLGIFPRGERPEPKAAEVNRLIATLEDDTVRYLDITSTFLEPDGSISKEVMWDHLHLAPKGFELWAKAIEQPVRELMATSNASVLAGPGPYKKLASVAAQLKSGTGYGKVLKMLAQKAAGKDAALAEEAARMSEAITSGGTRNLDAALALAATDPLHALPRLDRIAGQFAGHEIGTKAKEAADRLRKDPKVGLEIKADEAVRKLQALEMMLRTDATARDPTSDAFRRLNARPLESLVAGCRQLIARFPGTAGARKAEEILGRYLEQRAE